MEICKRLTIVDLPNKGVGMVALEPISKGDIIARWFPHDARTIAREVKSLEVFEEELSAIEDANERRIILNHSWPTSDGRIVVGARDGVFGCINHFHIPNVIHTFDASVWTTTACASLNPGDELCYNYNLGSQYDVRTDKFMIGFLALCDSHGVQKRPSLGMTQPPCHLSEKDLLLHVHNNKPLKSSVPAPRDDNGTTDCTVWI